jgi:hypothetical protein
VSSQEVLINVSDQVVERSSKILAQRSKSAAAKLITTKELKDLGKLTDILAAETLAMTGKSSSGTNYHPGGISRPITLCRPRRQGELE